MSTLTYDRRESLGTVAPRDAHIPVASINSNLIGTPKSRWRLSTPVLVLDLDAFDANIQRMAGIARRAGLALRPHAKTHKCSEIARHQIEAGAVGICCATVAEAAVMAKAGIRGIHVTSPATGEWKIRQLVEIARRSTGTMVVVDHESNLRDLSAAAEAAGMTIDVLVDIDPGMDRTGVVDDAGVFALARITEELRGIKFCGLQCYHGNLQHIVAFEERRETVEKLARRLERLRAELTGVGLGPTIVSGGGTGSAEMESAKAFTELQVGSYIFMDVEYCRVRDGDGNVLPFQPALFVAGTVINSHRNMQSTIDVGTKALVRGWAVPTVTWPKDKAIDYQFSGDEHGRLVYRKNVNEQLSPGDGVELFTPHCDPTVDLYAFYHCVRGDVLVDVWPIDARSQR